MDKKHQEAAVSESGFKREIGVFGGVSILGGIMIGSGIFYLGSYVLMRSGYSMGLALLCWIIGGIVSLLGGLCFAELGAADPKAGGMSVYLSKAYHPIVGYMNGFTSLLLSGAGSIAAVAIALPKALQSLFSVSEIQVKVIAIVLIVGLTIYNLFGVKLGTILQNVSMIAKLIPIGIIMIGALIFGKQTPNLSLVPQTGSVNFGSMIGMIAFATLATLWAYEGWTNLNAVAEEMKNPQKNLPKAIIIAIGGITLIYTLFNFSIYRYLPAETIQSLISSDQLYLGTEVAKGLFKGGATLVTAGMVISMFGCLNGMILAFPRVYYYMGGEGHFFKFYGKLHPKYKVPTAALIGQCVISIILVLLRNLNQLTNLVTFSGMLFNVMVVLAVYLYRKKFPKLERPYRIPGYPVTLIISVLLYAALMINTFVEDMQTAVIGLVVPLLGAVVYYLFDVYNKKKATNK